MHNILNFSIFKIYTEARLKELLFDKSPNSLRWLFVVADFAWKTKRKKIKLTKIRQRTKHTKEQKC